MCISNLIDAPVLPLKIFVVVFFGYQCGGPYVDGIDYNAVSIPSGTESYRFEQFADEYKQIFSIIANADEKPVYLHCTAGADRTGIVTFMLLTVCGADYEDIARDYLFTNFSTQGARYIDSEFNNWWSKLDNFEGDTKAEKANSWMLSKGITDEQVEKIREIFVAGYTYEIPDGDANEDGAVNSTDLVTLKRYLLNNGYKKVLDLNSNGLLDVIDLVKLKKATSK